MRTVTLVTACDLGHTWYRDRRDLTLLASGNQITPLVWLELTRRLAAGFGAGATNSRAGATTPLAPPHLMTASGSQPACGHTPVAGPLYGLQRSKCDGWALPPARASSAQHECDEAPDLTSDRSRLLAPGHGFGRLPAVPPVCSLTPLQILAGAWPGTRAAVHPAAAIRHGGTTTGRSTAGAGAASGHFPSRLKGSSPTGLLGFIAALHRSPPQRAGPPGRAVDCSRHDRLASLGHLYVLLRHKLWFSANHPLGAIAVGPSRPERGHCGCRQPDLGDNLRRRFAFCNPPVNLLSEPFPAFLDTTPGDAERVGEIPKSDSPLADGVVDFLVGAISVCQSSSPGGDPGSAASRRASASTPTRLAGLGRGAEKICGCRAARDRGRTGARRLIGSAAAQATRAVEPRAAGEPVDCGGSSGLEPTK